MKEELAPLGKAKHGRVRLCLALLLCAGLAALGPARPAAGQGGSAGDWPPECTVGRLGGQVVLTCLPEEWNGMLVLYAHGYVPPQDPLELPVEELDRFRTAGEESVIEALLEAEFAFATTSFSKNGYAVERAGEDLDALLDRFSDLASAARPEVVLVVGVSEGGLIAVQQLERHPERYQGGLALCAPLGGAPVQVQYLYDFRAVFDAYFPRVFGFGLADVPEDAYLEWDAYTEEIEAAMAANPGRTEQLFRVSGVEQDQANAVRSAITATLDLLHTGIWGTADLIDVAGGVPYGNVSPYRVYRGSADDAALNARVQRVEGDAQARAYVERHYQPTGQLQRPLVVLHTRRDPLTPYWHVSIYRTRAVRAGSSGLLTVLPVSRYGHCNLTRDEVLGAFGLLVVQATGSRPAGLEEYLP